jgi:predicted ATPase
MFKSLRLERFKNFKDAELKLGPFTVLIGANASGKSNIRDAFRFLHGIARGYNLTEIIGEKFSEGGEKVWTGLRGGARELAFSGGESCALTSETTFSFDSPAAEEGASISSQILRYRIELDVAQKRSMPLIGSESLDIVGVGHIMTSHAKDRKTQIVTLCWLPGAAKNDGPFFIPKSIPVMGVVFTDVETWPASSAEKFLERGAFEEASGLVLQLSQDFHEALLEYRSCRFFDWSLDALRQPCLPGQDMLSDNGRNLGSVLHAICKRPVSKKSLLSWIQELTPMDAVDFEFPVDPSGRILATLVERNKQKTTLASASDGTLRFLAFLAAFLGPNPSAFYFFEELENGIHPSRLNLLLDLIEHQVREKGIQVVATTHSPELLARLSKTSLEHAALVYRAPEKQDARIVRVLDFPEARRLLKAHKAADLFSSGWFETTADFSESASNGSPRTNAASKNNRARAK